MNQQQYRLMQIIQKIEVFQGLGVEDVQKLLAFCRPRAYESNQQIYRMGDASLDMFILLQGQLVVTSQLGKVLGEILPGNSVGEMGIFTGEPRGANIIASGKTGGIIITKQALDSLMSSEPAIRAKILQNMVNMLAGRLSGANKKIEFLTGKVQELQKKLGVS